MLGRKLSKTHLDNMANSNLFRQPNSKTGVRKQFTSMTQAAQFLGVHMTTANRYLDSSKFYNGYTITKVNSGSDL